MTTRGVARRLFRMLSASPRPWGWSSACVARTGPNPCMGTSLTLSAPDIHAIRSTVVIHGYSSPYHHIGGAGLYSTTSGAPGTWPAPPEGDIAEPNGPWANLAGESRGPMLLRYKACNPLPLLDLSHALPPPPRTDSTPHPPQIRSGPHS